MQSYYFFRKNKNIYIFFMLNSENVLQNQKKVLPLQPKNFLIGLFFMR